MITLFKSYKIFPKVIINLFIYTKSHYWKSFSLSNERYILTGENKAYRNKKKKKSSDIDFLFHWMYLHSLLCQFVILYSKFVVFLTISFILIKFFDILCFMKELDYINCAFVSIQTLTQPLNISRELCYKLLSRDLC